MDGAGKSPVTEAVTDLMALSEDIIKHLGTMGGAAFGIFAAMALCIGKGFILGWRIFIGAILEIIAICAAVAHMLVMLLLGKSMTDTKLRNPSLSLPSDPRHHFPLNSSSFENRILMNAYAIEAMNLLAPPPDDISKRKTFKHRKTQSVILDPPQEDGTRRNKHRKTQSVSSLQEELLIVRGDLQTEREIRDAIVQERVSLASEAEKSRGELVDMLSVIRETFEFIEETTKSMIHLSRQNSTTTDGDQGEMLPRLDSVDTSSNGLEGVRADFSRLREGSNSAKQVVTDYINDLESKRGDSVELEGLRKTHKQLLAEMANAESWRQKSETQLQELSRLEVQFVVMKKENVALKTSQDDGLQQLEVMEEKLSEMTTKNENLIKQIEDIKTEHREATSEWDDAGQLEEALRLKIEQMPIVTGSHLALAEESVSALEDEVARLNTLVCSLALEFDSESADCLSRRLRNAEGDLQKQRSDVEQKDAEYLRKMLSEKDLALQVALESQREAIRGHSIVTTTLKEQLEASQMRFKEAERESARREDEMRKKLEEMRTRLHESWMAEETMRLERDGAKDIYVTANQNSTTPKTVKNRKDSPTGVLSNDFDADIEDAMDEFRKSLEQFSELNKNLVEMQLRNAVKVVETSQTTREESVLREDLRRNEEFLESLQRALNQKDTSPTSVTNVRTAERTIENWIPPPAAELLTDPARESRFHTLLLIHPLRRFFETHKSKIAFCVSIIGIGIWSSIICLRLVRQ